MTGKLSVFFTGILLFSLLPGCSPEQARKERFVSTAYNLGYSDPRSAGINPKKLKKIDAIVKEAIIERATPGAVVVVLKDGEIIFDRAYGYHTYDKEVRTRTSDIFDVASVTKIFATTLAAMRLVDQGKLDLDADVGTYLSELNSSHPDKASIKVRDLLTHRAGFVPFIPFFRSIGEEDYSTEPSARYPVQVANRYYLDGSYYKEVMWKQMMDSPLNTAGKYVYSDISMYVMKEILERITGQPLDVYVDEQFYRPMGAPSAGFRPLERFPEERIVPTEDDTYFRGQLLRGYVHDPGAAMAGGVSGHAGLFASAYDLAILSRMLLNGGSYEGRQYIEPETVKLFSSRQAEDSRRGLGFDCWDPESKDGYPCRLASSGTFGHTGYTGTCVWIDPENRLIYIFLSNRLYHPRDLRKLLDLNIRPRIQDAVYEALQTPTWRSRLQSPSHAIDNPG